MRPFIHEDFLLSSPSAVRLFHEFTESMPIVDYHCHLNPKEIAENRRFENLTQIWLAGDHYKWRAMRAAGVEERYITGDAADWEKFEKWAAVVPKTLRNPLYHWTHLELNRPFGIHDRLLNPDTAREIWEKCNEKLAQENFTARGIMQQMNVRLVCTTDDPADSLEFHAAIAADSSFGVRVLPTFRPDRVMLTADVVRWNQSVDLLAAVSDTEISDYSSLLTALKKRHDFFASHGCLLSDHGFGLFSFDCGTESDAAEAFRKLRSGQEISPEKTLKFQSALLVEMAVWDHEKNWTQQLHIGALRNNNRRAFQKLGPDTGFDSMIDGAFALPLSRFLDTLDQKERLPRTILYNLNPNANDMLATMAGNFQDGKTPGKIQFGSGWWFLDQKNGMEQQIESLSNQGLLSLFIGMLTDSRSFLSYTRHEYFRRILCNLLGREMDQGLLPNEIGLVGAMVQDICLNNAVQYLGLSK
ncbi:MAG: glucuronate isomerase [Planctomycetaceae bacterium]|jgi:glucuronate isomerase|nr:glucuronate isomerase [Planctomycetaceae bacterium]